VPAEGGKGLEDGNVRGIKHAWCMEGEKRCLPQYCVDSEKRFKILSPPVLGFKTKKKVK